jgi:hypothetical protein
VSPAMLHLADRVAANPRFLAHPLARLQRDQHLSDGFLAYLLAMPVDGLPYLRLCGVPRVDHWTEDVANIAQAAGCDAGRLADLLGGIESYPVLLR